MCTHENVDDDDDTNHDEEASIDILKLVCGGEAKRGQKNLLDLVSFWKILPTKKKKMTNLCVLNDDMRWSLSVEHSQRLSQLYKLKLCFISKKNNLWTFEAIKFRAKINDFFLTSAR